MINKMKEKRSRMLNEQNQQNPNSQMCTRRVLYSRVILNLKLHNDIKEGLKRFVKLTIQVGKHLWNQYVKIRYKCSKAFQKIDRLLNQMQDYVHLRKISFANNQLLEVNSLQTINYLMNLHSSFNQITNLDCINVQNTFEFLEELNLDNNKIKTLDKSIYPRLKIAQGFNRYNTKQQIGVICGQNQYIICFRFQNLLKLKQIWAAQNAIISIGHLNQLPEMHILHLRANKIVVLTDIPNLPKLHHLNLRSNLIEKLDEFNNLKSLETLKLIIMHENQIASKIGDGIRKEIIMILQQIERINKDPVPPEENTDALVELKERIAAVIQKKRGERIRCKISLRSQISKRGSQSHTELAAEQAAAKQKAAVTAVKASAEGRTNQPKVKQEDEEEA
ncbi:unnamed protein product (macronuclear) [Paramecium tetraurelia]|uniref:U2A'/phosphoprotein 32 family A C-terminal domain-containing protein n=1 Tax=Paramecium tetraurelia TaxID=5888 RepID=A0CE83_PARTE|nr:uncharacterized protein GSPATT00037536001 [Paramecium tetraurelia]CAK69100.1 unnamed protein product [Paramecium tetraurelia]|eukprot:XP_001436497.1 hypothetical protein (macronuclear) [Paramecium tetraurelia strain d4-2]